MSFVTELSTDDGVVNAPTWEDVEQAIRALNGSANTLVGLAPDPPKGPPTGDHHMSIGGGAAGLYIVYATEDNVRFSTLRSATGSSAAKRRMLVGGQEGEFREEELVSIELAIHAARAYFETGENAPQLTWSEQPGAQPRTLPSP